METRKERAVILLRASSKQQTDREHDFDIPQQKKILLPYVASQNWEYLRKAEYPGLRCRQATAM